MLRLFLRPVARGEYALGFQGDVGVEVYARCVLRNECLGHSWSYGVFGRPKGDWHRCNEGSAMIRFTHRP